MVKLPTTAIALAALVTVSMGIALSGKTLAQGATCSSLYNSCYQKSVAGMTPAKAKADCNAAIRKCKQTGCFVGPHSGITFACNLAKQ